MLYYLKPKNIIFLLLIAKHLAIKIKRNQLIAFVLKFSYRENDEEVGMGEVDEKVRLSN